MSYLSQKSTIFVLSKNSEISARGPQFLVKHDGADSRAIPLVKVLDIVVHNSTKIGKAAITLAARHSIPVHFINNRGDYYGTLSNGLGANIFLRKLQYERRMDKNFVLALARQIVEGKRYSQQWVLDSFASGHTLPPVNDGESLGMFMGQEGKISAIYWKHFSALIKNDEFEFSKRSKRPPSDDVNALLSLGYVLLVNRITSILLYVGLDPYLGFYHQDFYRRPALTLDLMEEWRPVAVDKFVLNLLNRREVRPDDFVRVGAAVRLKPKPRNEFIGKWYGRWQKREFTSQIYKTKATLAQFCEWQCRKFSKVVTGELKEYVPFSF